MRITPLAVFISGFSEEEDIKAAIFNEVQITHPHVNMKWACYMYSRAIIYLI